jgi:type II secretory pathway pseudopilin PulG
MTSLNSLNFDRRFSIQKMIDICNGISIEDQKIDEKIRMGRNKSHNIDRSKIYLIDLILRLKKLSKYNDTYFTDNKKLKNKYIRDRVSTLIGIYANNMINNSDINFIDVYNFLGILAIIMINQNTRLYSDYFINYIKKIMAEDINESRKILVVFLYKFNEYIATLSKNSPDYNKYNSFILTYKKILFEINSKLMTSTNFKIIVNANTKEQLNIIAAQNKAKANAKAAQNKAKANAIAAQNKAIANAKAAQNKKCTEEWNEYNNYKNKNPRTFAFSFLRPIKRPTCGEEFRLSKKKPLNTNRSNIASNSFSTNLKNNTRTPNLIR